MLEKLLNSAELRAVRENIHESLLIEGLWDAPKALLVTLLSHLTGKHILILTGKVHEESSLFHDFPFFSDIPVLDFPAWETLPSEKIPPSPDIVGERYQALQKILEEKRPHIVLSSLQATLQKLIAPQLFSSLQLKLQKGTEISFKELTERLQAMGYERRPVASDKGEYAVRGGIIDIFPVSSPDPYRIEFFGDEVESLRIFDPIGQKSIRTVEQLAINPAKELEFLDQAPRLATILDYLGEDTIVILDDLLTLEDRYAQLTGLSSGSKHFLEIEDLLSLLEIFQTIFLPAGPISELSETRMQGDIAYFELFKRAFKAKRLKNPFMYIDNFLHPEEEGFSEEELLGALHDPTRKEETWTILTNSESEKKALLQKINQPTVHFDIQMGYLSEGFVLPKEQLILCSLTEITHRYKLRRQKQRSTYHTPPTETFELSSGDMVVHLQQGIGRFLGMEERPDHNGMLSEFFLLEYANGAKLFVPMNQAHLITKYIGTNDEMPRMHELGSTRWKKAKEKTQQAIVGYAKDLLEFYAKRSITEGFIYPADSDDVSSFEDEFPYEETKDQLDAIENTKKDMCSKKIMDRLVCGDVGYGKTEVAMRAAFKAVVDGGKQVAVLVPTTVLAMQHYENFVERMRDFPVTVGVLSRFLTQKEIKQTLEGVKSGAVDIVIGTHRLISEDVSFKDLGLIVIDEEQRFGVRAKEHLKKIKVGVDCLTLSATPIPRTLYLSLMGARDLSIINTPPQDRIPIKTALTEFSEELITSAVRRELARDGQVFFIHNRVETIFDTASLIKKLVPEARVVIGHGQMTSNELDTVFHQFKKGDANVLVATSIVENGIDMPNANTILIDRAERFGLAELYQLRGRVGRWNRRAYCYFLVNRLSTLPEISRKRLNALAETSGYGGGMKIALRDLEIRGAGNILGEEQSGQVEAIGFHQYCKWLKKAVNSLRDKTDISFAEVKLDCKIDARLPENYINEVSLRMEFYQRLGEATSLQEVDDIALEIMDRFGPLPETAEWLMSYSRVKAFATTHGFTTIEVGTVSVTLEKMSGKNPSKRQTLFKPKKNAKEWEEALIQLMQETTN